MCRYFGPPVSVMNICVQDDRQGSVIRGNRIGTRTLLGASDISTGKVTSPTSKADEWAENRGICDKES